MRPAGADNFLRWRRTIDEHLERRRLSWNEYAMFSWLCTKANPRTGTVWTNWPTLAAQTGLSPDSVERLCRRLKKKRYVWYPIHRGRRSQLVDVAIHKFPLPGDTYLDLASRFEAEPSDVEADGAPELASDRRSDSPPDQAPDHETDGTTEVDDETSRKSRVWTPGRVKRIEKREETSLRVRSADPTGWDGCPGCPGCGSASR